MALLRFIQAVQLTALVEYFGFRRVQVLGHTVAQYASTKSDYPPAFVADGEHHTFAEAIVSAPLIVSHQHSGIVQCCPAVGITPETL
ncbi:hypothetical protein D3C80_1704870 [compost metagenome]